MNIAFEHPTVEHGRFFTSLPREYYVSEEIFQRELQRVFARDWLYAGHVSMVKEPGDFYVRDVGPESLIITRDTEGRLRAFFNVCRHRGSRICASGASGHAKRLICPYHQWGYDVNGRLCNAPGAKDGEDFVFSDWGLHEAHCEVYFGSIYVYLADESPSVSLNDVLTGVTSNHEKLALVEPERTKLAHREIYEIEANWKLLLENNCECYHCPGGHAALCVAWNPLMNYTDLDLEPDPGLYVPLREGTQTFSMDGRWVSAKPLGTPQAERFSTGFILTPNFSAVAYFADHGVAIDVAPITLSRTRMTCEWYVHEDAVEGVDYDPQQVAAVFHQTNLEDITFAEENHKGVTSMRFVPGPNNPKREPGILKALKRYLELMGADA